MLIFTFGSIFKTKRPLYRKCKAKAYPECMLSLREHPSPHTELSISSEKIYSPMESKGLGGPNVSGNFLVTLPFPSSPLLPHFPLMIKVKTFMEMERGFYEGRKESFYSQNAIYGFISLYSYSSPLFPLFPFPPPSLLTPSPPPSSLPHKEEQEKD